MFCDISPQKGCIRNKDIENQNGDLGVCVCVCVCERERFVVFAFNIIMAIGNSFPPVITFYLSYLWLFCTFFLRFCSPKKSKKHMKF